MSNLGIGQLAQRAGVAIDTVRCYERNNLLDPAERLASGYRRGASAMVTMAAEGTLTMARTNRIAQHSLRRRL